MGRKSLQKKRALDPEIRKKWMDSLVPYFLKNGFRRVTMEDIAKKLGVSKATLYEHYHSQDELYELAVDFILDEIRINKEILYLNNLPYQDRFVHLVAMILKQIIGISPILLEDIKYFHPDLWQKYQDFYQEWDLELRNFFKLAMKDDVFNKVDPAILSRLITGILREILSPEFLMNNQITVQQAFVDLFRLLTRGVFKDPEQIEDQLEKKLQEVIAGTLFFPTSMLQS